MAGTVKNLMVRAGADFSAITKQSKKAEASMASMASGIKGSCAKIQTALGGLKAAAGVMLAVRAIKSIVNAAKEAAEAYDAQAESEVKLAQVMRNTIGASNDEIRSILALTAAQQELGVIGDEVQIAGAQELATYVSLTSTLETLIPVMNDMAAQQYGYNVTAEQAAQIAAMLGKVMEGQVSGLSRLGYYFTDAQAKVLKYGTETQRAAMLAEIVSQSVGGMNRALASTPTGQMQQLRNTMGDIKEQFGQAARTIGTIFLPILNTVATVLAYIAKLANKAAQAIAKAFGGTVAGNDWEYIPPGTAGDIEDATNEMDDLTQATNGAAAAAKKLQQADFDNLHILSSNDSGGSGGGGTNTATTGTGGGGIEQAGPALEDVTEEGETATGVMTRFRDLVATINFEPLIQSIGNLQAAVTPLATCINTELGPAYTNVLLPLSNLRFTELTDSIDDLTTHLSDTCRLVIHLITTLKASILATLRDLLSGLTSAVQDFTKLFSSLVTRIRLNIEILAKTIASSVEDFVTEISTDGERLMELWDKLASKLKSAVDDISHSYKAMVVAAKLATVAIGVESTLLKAHWGGLSTKMAATAASVALSYAEFVVAAAAAAVGTIAADLPLTLHWASLVAKAKELAEEISTQYAAISTAVTDAVTAISAQGDLLKEHWTGLMSDAQTAAADISLSYATIIVAAAAAAASIIAAGALVSIHWNSFSAAAAAMQRSLDKSFRLIGRRADQFRKDLTKSFTEMTDELGNLIEKLGETIEKRFVTMQANVTAVVQTLQNVVNALFRTLCQTASMDITALCTLVTTMIRAMTTDIRRELDVLLTQTITTFDRLFEMLYDRSSRTRDQILTIFQNLTSGTLLQFNILHQNSSILWESIKHSIFFPMNDLSGLLATIIEGIKSKWTSVSTTLSNTLLGIWESLRSKLANVFSAISTHMQNIWSWLTETAVNVWNFATDTTGNRPPIREPKTPFAEGGIVPRRSLFGNNVVGERGMEAIIPLERNTEWITRVSAQLTPQLQPSIAASISDSLGDMMADRLGSEDVLSVLGEILDAVLAGQVIEMDNQRLGRTVRRIMTQQNRAFGT